MVVAIRGRLPSRTSATHGHFVAAGLLSFAAGLTKLKLAIASIDGGDCVRRHRDREEIPEGLVYTQDDNMKVLAKTWRSGLRFHTHGRCRRCVGDSDRCRCSTSRKTVACGQDSRYEGSFSMAMVRGEGNGTCVASVTLLLQKRQEPLCSNCLEE